MLILLYILCWSVTICTVMYVVVDWMESAQCPLKERLPSLIVGLVFIVIFTSISICVTDQIKI